jgi:hypothetical protein
MLQVSLDPEPMVLELFQGTAIRYQTLLGFGGAFTGASGKLGHRSFRTGASPGSSLAIVAPSLMLQVSLGSELLRLELLLDPAIRYQTLLAFGGAFTDASGELGRRANGTGASIRR